MNWIKRVLHIGEKIKRVLKKRPSKEEIESSDTRINRRSYVDVKSRVKKDHITPDNIGEIILSQIPGISSTTSLAIMTKFGSLYNLLITLKEDQHCLDEVVYITRSGQTRRISKSSISNIVQYLLYQKSNVIKIDT